jgi:ADP-L-glycero-D-manno-heptose 6-epimerase
MHIVTGAAGFIGSAIVWKLNQLGVTDILIVDDLGHSEKWKNLVKLRFEDYIHKKEFLHLVVEKGEDPFGCESIIHMGACSSTTETDANYLMDNNYRYTQMVCRFALNNSIKFINASSAATYGDGALGFDYDLTAIENLRPLNMYGYTKQLFDLWAHGAKLFDHIVSLKFFNVFGPNEYHKGDMMSVVRKAFDQINQTDKLNLFKSYRKEYEDGGQQRDFVYVKDVVDVVAWLVEHPDVSGLFNVGCGQARSWNELAAAVFRAMDKPYNVEYVDMPGTLREKYQYFTQARIKRLRDAGYTKPFTSLEDAAADYIQGHLMQPDPYL